MVDHFLVVKEDSGQLSHNHDSNNQDFKLQLRQSQTFLKAKLKEVLRLNLH